MKHTKLFYSVLFIIGILLSGSSVSYAKTLAEQKESERKFVESNEELLGQLPKQQATVLRKLYLEGKSPQDIESGLGITQKTISQHKTAGLERLRELADPDGSLVRNNEELLSQLSKQQAKVLRMLFIEGKSPQDIESELGIVQHTVSQHKTAGLERLRELADPDGSLVRNNEELLSQLSKQQAKVLRMLFIEGKSPQDIESELGIVQHTVSQHKTAGLERLRELADPDGSLVRNNEELLGQLSKQQATVLRMLFIEGKSFQDIESGLGITQKTISKYKTAGLEWLRSIIAKNKSVPANSPCAQVF